MLNIVAIAKQLKIYQRSHIVLGRTRPVSLHPSLICVGTAALKGIDSMQRQSRGVRISEGQQLRAIGSIRRDRLLACWCLWRSNKGSWYVRKFVLVVKNQKHWVLTIQTIQNLKGLFGCVVNVIQTFIIKCSKITA